jgi:pyrroline-5-carboxylate reductase
MILGFVGTGTITAAMVEGLRRGALADWPVVLSPRGATVAAGLAARFLDVTVAESNQAVVDAADCVVLAIRPQVAEAVISGLTFREGQRVLSLVAAYPVDRVAALARVPVASVVRAIPLPFVASGQGVTPIYPPDADMAALFRSLGGVIEVGHLPDFDTYATASALMGSYFGLVEAATGWMVARGVAKGEADAYLRALFGSLGDVLRADPAPLDRLREEHSTRGGLNEMAHRVLVKGGGHEALRAALDAVLGRIRG